MPDVSMTIDIIFQNSELGEQYVAASVTASSLDEMNRKVGQALHKLAEEFDNVV